MFTEIINKVESGVVFFYTFLYNLTSFATSPHPLFAIKKKERFERI